MTRNRHSRRGFLKTSVGVAAAGLAASSFRTSRTANAQAFSSEKVAVSNLKVQVPIDEIVASVKGRRAGVLTNATVWLEQIGDDVAGLVKRHAKKTVLLAAEHGLRGDGGDGKPQPCTYDAYFGCEIRGSLYDPNRSSDMIADLDVLVVGMFDVGCRHYTYKTAMCHLMEIAAKVGKPVVVVDLPNPVRGDRVEGNYPVPDFYTKYFTAHKYIWCGAPITYRHGMTIGELALLSKAHLQLDLDLRVLKMHGWRRDMWWDQTGWPYLPFDPSMYTTVTTLGFLCTGLLQGANVSWGIGTADPFCVIGAPWINDDRLLRALRQRNLAGVTWTRALFTPRWREPKASMWNTYSYQPCNGVKLQFTDRNAVCTAEVQLSLLVELCRLYPEQFQMDKQAFTNRLEDPHLVKRLKAGEGVETILAEWKADDKKFEQIRKDYLLY
jgi:uncharacterized protein YbbC (DUF1343 family)